MLRVRDVRQVGFTWKEKMLLSLNLGSLETNEFIKMIVLLDEEELMLASKLLVRDSGMSTIRLACEMKNISLLSFSLKNYARWWQGL